MLLFSEDQLIKDERLKFFWLKEKLPKLVLFFCLTFICNFFFSFLVPFNYFIEAEVLLKKKSVSGFEAVAIPNYIGDKFLQDLSIEPFFYSKKIVEEAIKNSALQIEKDQSIFDQIKILFKVFMKKEMLKTYSFSNCQFQGINPLIFCIRKIADNRFEILFDKQKSQYSIGQKINLGSSCFVVTSLPDDQNIWQTYKIDNLEKIYKKVLRSLKVRVDKKTKSILLINFFSKESKIGENFLSCLIDEAKKEADFIQKNIIYSELTQLKEMMSQIKDQLFLFPSFNEYELKKKQLQELIRSKIKIEKEIKNFSYQIKDIELLLTKEDFICFSVNFPKELTELIKIKELFFVDKIDRENHYNSYLRKDLEILLQEKNKILQNYIEELNQLSELKEQVIFTNLISYPKSFALTKLFAQKKQLEENTKNLSQTEKNQLEIEKKMVENQINYEFDHLTRSYEKKIDNIKIEINGINQAIYCHLDKEIAYLKNNFANELSFKKTHNQFLIDQAVEELKKIEKKIIDLTAEVNALSEKIIRKQELVKISTINEEKIVQKSVEYKIEKFFGETIFEPRSSYYPLFMLRIFLLFLISLIIVLAWLCVQYLKANFNGWFPSDKLISAFNWEKINKSDLEKIVGKKLQLTNRKHHLKKNFATYTKKLEDLENFDYKFFDLFIVDSKEYSFKQIEELKKKHHRVVLY